MLMHTASTYRVFQGERFECRGAQALPGGGELILYNDPITKTTFSVDERDGQTFEGRLERSRRMHGLDLSGNKRQAENSLELERK